MDHISATIEQIGQDQDPSQMHDLLADSEELTILLRRNWIDYRHHVEQHGCL